MYEHFSAGLLALLLYFDYKVVSEESWKKLELKSHDEVMDLVIANELLSDAK